jgi:pimeloyl-ACP methyl ester carboxylesterase
MGSKANVRRPVRGAVSLIVSSILLAGISAAASAQSSAARFAEARCDDRKAAEIVQRELGTIADFPETQSILYPPNTGALYYDLVMREPHEAPADHRIYYGSNLQQFGDLRLPKGRGPFPVAVLIHGGGWSSSISLHYMAPLAASLTCAGIATWNIEFRRLGSGGEWPGLFRDLAAATDFLRQLALKYPLDLSRGVVTIGHSSGGSLAMWLAMRHRLSSDSELFTPNPLPVAGGVSLDGAVDMLRRLADGPSVAGQFMQLFGADGASPEVVEKRMKDASPRHYLPLGVRQLIVQGNPGGTPWYGCCGTPEHVAEAQALGDEIEYIVLDDAFHFESADPNHHQAGPAVRRTVRSMSGYQMVAGRDNE